MFNFLAPQNTAHKWVGIFGSIITIAGPWVIIWSVTFGCSIAIIGFLSLVTYLEFLPVLNQNMIQRILQVLLILILAILLIIYVFLIFILIKK